MAAPPHDKQTGGFARVNSRWRTWAGALTATVLLATPVAAEYGDVVMNKFSDKAGIIDGEFCGACHDGQIAWSVENCDLCHSANPKTPTQVHESTLQKLLAPTSTGGSK